MFQDAMTSLLIRVFLQWWSIRTMSCPWHSFREWDTPSVHQRNRIGQDSESLDEVVLEPCHSEWRSNRSYWLISPAERGRRLAIHVLLRPRERASREKQGWRCEITWDQWICAGFTCQQHCRLTEEIKISHSHILQPFSHFWSCCSFFCVFFLNQQLFFVFFFFYQLGQQNWSIYHHGIRKIHPFGLPQVEKVTTGTANHNYFEVLTFVLWRPLPVPVFVPIPVSVPVPVPAAAAVAVRFALRAARLPPVTAAGATLPVRALAAALPLPVPLPVPAPVRRGRIVRQVVQKCFQTTSVHQDNAGILLLL